VDKQPRRAQEVKSVSDYFVVAVSLLVILVSVVQLATGPEQVGVTFDEPVHLSRSQAWLDDGWYVPQFLIKDGEPDGSMAASPFVYGTSFSAVTHTLNRVIGIESAGEVSNSEGAWTSRHLVTALLALLGAMAAAIAVLSITGSRMFALWTAAALLAIPIWTGMGFFNPKDTPTATGYTLFTTGLVVALARQGTTRASVLRGSAIATLVAVGYFFGAGTRLALWLPLAGTLGAFALLYWARVRLAEWNPDYRLLAFIAGGLLAGIAATVLSYPAVFADPVEFLRETVTSSSSFEWTGQTLTAGRLLSQHPPWWYLPAWTIASIPTLLLGLAILGTAVAFKASLLRSGGDRVPRSVWRRPELAISLVLMQAVGLVLICMLISATMYTGLRQHLYVVPALAILAGIGGHWLWIRTGNRLGRSRTWTAVLLCFALALPAIEGGLLFPYNYTYVSPVAGLGGVNGRWETDFFWASTREAEERLPDHTVPYCSGQPDDPAALQPCANFHLPYLTNSPSPELPASSGKGDTWMLGRMRSNGEMPSGCTDEDNVTRWLRGERVVMSFVARCRLPGSG